MPLAQSQKELLLTSAVNYHRSLPGSPGDEYLQGRGLPLPAVERFRLGYVGSPVEGHEEYKGRLAIPYLRRTARGDWLVVSMKFRSLSDVRPKYLGLHGENGKPRLYNTVDALDSEMALVITEGEIDAMAASSLVGLPAVGVPGANTWDPSWTLILKATPRLWVLHDGDDAGKKFARAVQKEISHAIPIPMPDGEDVNSTVQLKGSKWILERMGLAGPIRQPKGQ